MDLITILIVVSLLILSGLFSGLTLGLMSLSPDELERKIEINNKYAKKIYPIRKNGNLLLCTLLLGNVAVNSALSVFLGSIIHGMIALGLSTGLIVVFGEIFPQALFSKHSLRLGANSVWLIYPFLFALYPIAKPISFALDKILGKELPTLYQKEELSLLAKDQRDLHMINQQEFKMIESSLEFKNKVVREVMTPRVETYFLHVKEILDLEKINEIKKEGLSRIPVFDDDKDDIVGVLFVKDLLGIDPEDKISIRRKMRKEFFSVKDEDSLEKTLKKFKRKRTHLFVVRDEHGGVDGIITLEDIVEEIIGEIVDEYDFDEIEEIEEKNKARKKSKKKSAKKQ